MFKLALLGSRETWKRGSTTLMNVYSLHQSCSCANWGTGHYLFAGEGTVLVKFIWSSHKALSYSYDPPHSGSQFLYSLLYTDLIYLNNFNYSKLIKTFSVSFFLKSMWSPKFPPPSPSQKLMTGPSGNGEVFCSWSTVVITLVVVLQHSIQMPPTLLRLTLTPLNLMPYRCNWIRRPPMFVLSILVNHKWKHLG